MNGFYLFGIRTGQHASLIASAENTPRGRAFLLGRYRYWTEQSQSWDIVFLLHIDADGHARQAHPFELEDKDGE